MAIDTSYTIGNVTFPNPVGAASGVIGFGDEYSEEADLASLGCLYTKALSFEPRLGNPPPRLVETPSGLINSIGLANPGIQAFLKEKVPILEKLPCPAVVNVAGGTEEEFGRIIEAIDSIDIIKGYELNISCPNASHAGLAFGTDPVVVERLVKGARGKTGKPLIVKLTPNVTDITLIAQAAEAGGADALSCINTLIGMAIDRKKKAPVLPRGTGGLSGPAVKPVGLAAVYRVSRAVSVPVIGIGGIMGWDDAVDYLLAGASAVQAGSGLFVNPLIIKEIKIGIEKYMNEEGLSSIKDFHSFF